MLERRVISITSKGQATIPTDLRRKFGFGKRALVEETAIDLVPGLLVPCSIPCPPVDILEYLKRFFTL